MRSSFLLGAVFVSGLVAGRTGLLPRGIYGGNATMALLVVLLFLVGVLLGGRTEMWAPLRQAQVRLILVPLAVALGTLAGVSIFPLLQGDLSFRDAWAVGSGLGYYSLSSVLIAQARGEMLGTLALLTNIFREMLTLVGAPLFVHLGGKLGSMAAGGATSMDTTLPAVIRSSGKEFALLAVFSGIAQTLLVPFLVSFFLSLERT